MKIPAEDNNHRGDAKVQHDRILKALQQKFLRLVRALAFMHPVMVEAGEETTSLSQQLFLLVLNMEDEIVKKEEEKHTWVGAGHGQLPVQTRRPEE